MPRYYKRKRSTYRRRRRQYGRKRRTKVYRRRPTFRKRVPRRANILQVHNLLPATVTQKFENVTRWTVSPSTPSANTKSIYTINVAGLVQPTFASGTWSSGYFAGTTNMYPGLKTTALKWNHCYVLGAKLTVHVRPTSNQATPSKNICWLVESDSAGRVNQSMSSIDLDTLSNVKSGMYFNDGREHATTLSMGYSPSKVWGCSKGAITTKNDLKCVTNPNNSTDPLNTGTPNDGTFFSVILGDRSDNNIVGHDQALVTIKVQHLIKFVERRNTQVTSLPDMVTVTGGE